MRHLIAKQGDDSTGVRLIRYCCESCNFRTSWGTDLNYPLGGGVGIEMLNHIGSEPWAQA